MICLKQETLIAYLDRELPAQDRSRAEHHLKMCARCRGALIQLQGDIALVRQAIADLEPERVIVPQFEIVKPKRHRGSFQDALLHRLSSSRITRSWLGPAAVLLVAGVALILLLPMFAGDRTNDLNILAATYEQGYLHENANTAWHSRSLVINIIDNNANLVGKIVTSRGDETGPAPTRDTDPDLQNSTS